MSRNAEAITKVNDALARVHSDMDASECHGLVAGLLCANVDTTVEEWQDVIAPNREPGDLLMEEGLTVLEALRQETQRQLASSVLDFHPLLPDEDTSLEGRVLTLAEWVQGFLAGLAEGGLKELEKLPADSAEIVRDFAEIARAGGYEFAEGEEDEGAYSELLEYVRAGVLLLNEELNPTKAPPRGDITLH